MLACFDEFQGYTWPEISIVELLHGRCDAKEAGGGESGGRPTSREEERDLGQPSSWWDEIRRSTPTAKVATTRRAGVRETPACSVKTWLPM
jgi:hypothetical protein